MATPDPNSLSFFGAIGAGLAVIVSPVLWIHRKLGEKADKHTVNNQFQEVKNELALQRQTQAKLFDQIRDSDQRAQDRHERLMEHVTRGGRQ